jgi:hypothetical protein
MQHYKRHSPTHCVHHVLRDEACSTTTAIATVPPIQPMHAAHMQASLSLHSALLHPLHGACLQPNTRVLPPHASQHLRLLVLLLFLLLLRLCNMGMHKLAASNSAAISAWPWRNDCMEILMHACRRLHGHTLFRMSCTWMPCKCK